MFLFSRTSVPFTQPLVVWIQGVLPPGVTRLRCKADRLHVISAKVKNDSGCTAIPPHTFTSQCLAKLRNVFFIIDFFLGGGGLCFVVAAGFL